MARPSAIYEPRAPVRRVLYQVVRDHLETFRAQASRVGEGTGLPRFIEEEFEGFLRCGFLAGGFARLQCDGCGLDRLVPFSCKGRAVCPSCGGRRMAERAAHLVDHVFPEVPVRQWVLTLPPRIRYLLAWDHALCRAVIGVFMRAVLGFLRQRARQAHGVADGRGGAVIIVQRFGSALNVNVHAHALVLDGVFAEDGAGGLRFHPAAPPRDAEMGAVLATIERRVRRLLARRGASTEEEGGDRWAVEEPVLAGLAAASVQGPGGARAPRRGRGAALRGVRGSGGAGAAAGAVPRPRRRLRSACGGRRAGPRSCPAGAHMPLRPASTRGGRSDSHDPRGQVRLELRHRWSDGTTHLLFDPLELLERLASLTPRPRINLVLYYGVLGAHAAWRPRLGGREAVAPATISGARPDDRPAGVVAAGTLPAGSTGGPRRGSNLLWAQLMQRSFGFDVLACPRCAGRFRLLALIEDSRVIQRILHHLRLPVDIPAARAPRAPPLPLAGVHVEDDLASP